MKANGRFQSVYRQWLPNSRPPGIIQLVTEDYPPLTYWENGRATDFVTDVVREITDQLDINAPIRLTTWDNADNMARVNPNWCSSAPSAPRNGRTCSTGWARSAAITPSSTRKQATT